MEIEYSKSYPLKYLLYIYSEVLKALLKTRDLYERWRLGDEGVEIRSSEEQEWAATELRNSLRSIEWDLEDLDDTVQIVEKNPAKFRIEVSDLTARKNFIKQTKEEVELMKQRSSVQNKISNRFNSDVSDFNNVVVIVWVFFINLMGLSRSLTTSPLYFTLYFTM